MYLKLSSLKTKVISDKTSGVKKTTCAEIAASIALDVLKKSEGIRTVKELGLAEKAAAVAEKK